jgi:hypothetical protein
MRIIFVSLFIILSSFCMGQVSIVGDTLASRVYDTSLIEIRSKAYFPFCASIYSLPRENCDGNNPPNCCSYSTSLSKNQKIADWGYVSCYNGSSFTWHYSTSLGSVRNMFEDIPIQMEKQQKTFSKKHIKCSIYNDEAEAYLIEQETYQGHKFYTLTTYGTHKGFYFYLEYHSIKEISSNADIQAVFRQIIGIK